MQVRDPGVRIYDRPDGLWLEVRGALAESAVRELEMCWRAGASVLGMRSLMVDLGPATGTDGAGKELLRRMAASGANFVVQDARMRGVVEEAGGRLLEPVRSVVRRGLGESIRHIARTLLCPFFGCEADASAGR